MEVVMMKNQNSTVVVPAARTGRPSSRARVYAPDETVRFDARIPAHLAVRLYEAARASGRPVTAVHADLLAKALDDEGGADMG